MRSTFNASPLTQDIAYVAKHAGLGPTLMPDTKRFMRARLLAWFHATEELALARLDATPATDPQTIQVLARLRSAVAAFKGNQADLDKFPAAAWARAITPEYNDIIADIIEAASTIVHYRLDLQPRRLDVLAKMYVNSACANGTSKIAAFRNLHARMIAASGPTMRTT